MIPRELESKLRDSARNYPVVTVFGPRQSGKTTLCRATFPDKALFLWSLMTIENLQNLIPEVFWRNFPVESF